jgi:hypothetical protein
LPALVRFLFREVKVFWALCLGLALTHVALVVGVWVVLFLPITVRSVVGLCFVLLVCVVMLGCIRIDCSCMSCTSTPFTYVVLDEETIWLLGRWDSRKTYVSEDLFSCCRGGRRLETKMPSERLIGV